MISLAGAAGLAARTGATLGTAAHGAAAHGARAPSPPR